MRLIGQLDSPFVRRVAVTLHHLGLAFEQAPLSVFGDAQALRRLNPLGRVPALRLDDGEVLVDSGAILDWLDELAGPERALVPRGGAERWRALRQMALAAGIIEKVVAVAYETVLRPERYRWPEWVERCRDQAASALAALEAEAPVALPLGQPAITAACAIAYVRLAQPDLLPPGRYPRLEALSLACEALPAFAATRPAAYALPAAGG